MLLKNGHLIDPTTKTNEFMDIRIENGIITKIAKDLTSETDEEILDLSGLTIAPEIKEIGRVAALPEVQDALRVLQDRNKKHRISGYLEHGEYGKIAEMVMQKLKKEAPRRLLRQILYSL